MLFYIYCLYNISTYMICKKYAGINNLEMKVDSIISMFRYYILVVLLVIIYNYE